MEKPCLNDPAQPPLPDVLEAVLKKSFVLYNQWLELLTAAGAEVVWTFYRDGGAWLARAVFRKKTLCWISAWDGFFKCTFYFTEKTVPGILNAGLNPFITEKAFASKNTGKLIPVTVDVCSATDLIDLQKLLDYKKSLK